MTRIANGYLLLSLLAAGAATAQSTHDPAAAGHHHGAPQAGGDGASGPPAGADHALRHQGPIDHSFADAEEWAERFESDERETWQMPDRVVEALAPAAGDNVADIGSGTGYFSRRFADAVGPEGTVYASDVEPGMAEYVRRRADDDGQRNLVPVLASYDDPRLPNNSLDLIFICNTWHHIQDRVDYARRLAGDLAVGGRVAIVDFREGELPVGPGPEHKLSAAEVAEEFRQAGFRQVESHQFLPYQYALVFAAPSRSVDIQLAGGTDNERRVEAQLRRLLESHVLDPWLFTRKVRIDETERIPHSHPVLTLTGSEDDDAALLATFIHEQLHWWVLRDQKRLGGTIAAFRELFPEVPSGRAGARDEQSTYLHLVVCDLELQAMTRLVGEEKARAVIGGWQHYTWIYQQVLENPGVRRINERFGMLVP